MDTHRSHQCVVGFLWRHKISGGAGGEYGDGERSRLLELSLTGRNEITEIVISRQYSVSVWYFGEAVDNTDMRIQNEYSNVFQNLPQVFELLLGILERKPEILEEDSAVSKRESQKIKGNSDNEIHL
ncbi:hypothetical protein EVAR_11621_1 [Eumeta japonica]|uniref:Uncharacterized protein n=1 Tax=Eumeta variegata TaxID=151549 RepID=A0A4C1WXG1_EUMVA|nr:hypothetical protein EVAR_11621_1 [Eumeta japonica]